MMCWHGWWSSFNLSFGLYVVTLISSQCKLLRTDNDEYITCSSLEINWLFVIQLRSLEYMIVDINVWTGTWNSICFSFQKYPFFLFSSFLRVWLFLSCSLLSYPWNRSFSYFKIKEIHIYMQRASLFLKLGKILVTKVRTSPKMFFLQSLQYIPNIRHLFFF